MQVRLAQATDQQNWNDFLMRSQGSFLQSWAWGDFQQALGWKVWRYIAEDSGHIQEVALVIKHELPGGMSWLYLPGGQMVNNSDSQIVRWSGGQLEEKLKEIGKLEKAIFMRADFKSEADVPTGWKKAPREVQPKDTLVLNLEKPEEDLLAQMHQKTRYNIRLAQKRGVTVRFSTDVKDVEVFLQLSKSVAGRADFSYHPDDYYRNLIEVLGVSNMAELAIAEYEGQPLAAHIMIYSGEMATYVHGASTQEKRELMAPQLLYWETIRRAREKGYKAFDYYGVAPENADNNHPWAGITRVKMGFGGRRVTVAGAYDLVLKPLWYWGMNMARSIRSRK